MTLAQRLEIERLLRLIYTPEEAAQFWRTPQSYLDGRLPEESPTRTIEVLQALADGAYL